MAAAGLSLALILVGTFYLYARNNDFPAYYHEDEGTKAWQVISNTRNFTQPQLMLEVTQIATKLLRTSKAELAVLIVGRSVSAFFAAVAAAAMALLGYRIARVPGMLACGVAVGLCPALVVHAHYMKEDAALMAGFCLAVLACRVAWEGRERPLDFAGVCFLGASCALATSGKYAGVMTLLMAALLVATMGRPRRKWMLLRLSVLLLSFALVLVIVNHRAFDRPGVWLERFPAEVTHAATGHRDLTMSRPNLYHAAAFVRQCMPHVLVLSGVFVILTLAGRGPERRWDLFLIAFAVAYLVAVSLSKLPYYRYVLPVVVLAHVMAALAFVRLLARRPALIAAAAGLLALAQLPRCLDYDEQFGNDSRERLRAWIVLNLPSDAIFVQDEYLGLDQPFDPRTGTDLRPEIRIYGGTPAPTNGSVAELRRIGVEYIAIDDTEYNRYLDPHLLPAPDSTEEFAQRRRWYEELFRTGRLVWSSAPRHPTYSFFNNPEVRLYRLRPSSGE